MFIWHRRAGVWKLYTRYEENRKGKIYLNFVCVLYYYNSRTSLSVTPHAHVARDNTHAARRENVMFNQYADGVPTYARARGFTLKLQRDATRAVVGMLDIVVFYARRLSP